MAYTVKLFLTNTGLNTWTVPPDWTSVNTIECIGGGGSGSYNNGYGNGGGGGAKGVGVFFGSWVISALIWSGV